MECVVEEKRSFLIQADENNRLARFGRKVAIDIESLMTGTRETDTKESRRER
jgi:hypothetical protein